MSKSYFNKETAILEGEAPVLLSKSDGDWKEQGFNSPTSVLIRLFSVGWRQNIPIQLPPVSYLLSPLSSSVAVVLEAFTVY